MLSHLNSENQPAMVDVSGKKATKRTAHARTVVAVPGEVAALFADGDIQSAKGPVFQTAIVAGVMAAKKTSELIPLCHPIGLEDCQIDIRLRQDREIQIDCRATVTHKTGVEMEALTAASVASLTIYDMMKWADKGSVISETKLLHKSGGKSGDYDA